MYRAASCFLSSLCLLLRFVLNCAAKVQRYLQPTKHFAKNLCIFNLLQQISMFLPKFIHILSTKSIKCAIYKAKMFAFRLQYAHTRTRTYIKTNINAIFVVCLRICLQRVVVGYSVGYIPAKLPPLQNTWFIFFAFVCPLPCAVVGVLRWINTYYLCAVCRVRAWYVFRVYSCVLRYGTFYLCLLVFIQSLMFRK